MGEAFNGPLEQLDDNRFLIPKSYKRGMRVDGVIYADKRLISSIRDDQAPEQVANVACLPGIVGYSLAMPDIHWGYGFCIGGVAATDPAAGGVVSPGGVGYDINCGVRILKTDLSAVDVKPVINRLVDRLFSRIPAGVGGGGDVVFKRKEMQKVLEFGSKYIISEGFGWNEDLDCTEAHGTIRGARPDLVSDRAYERGSDQCGTLGSGNHFLEVQVVDQVFDERAASIYGLQEGKVTVMIHSGSRGLGYQVCEDSLRKLQGAAKKFEIFLPDRQLVCAPVESEEGQEYLGAMRAAANFAWASRQIMTHLAREVFGEVFGQSAERLGMHLLYDVAHNIAKLEEHQVNGRLRTLCVHRKGATRSFPAGHPETPERYRAVGQPVIVPGDMGRYSFVLSGGKASMEQTFGSCCHGAGRMLSRKAAVKAAKGRSIANELLERGVVARARGRAGLEEEQPDAYKDVNAVVDVVHKAGLAHRVARLRPIGVIKG